LIAGEQTYFWTPEWQAKEQAADEAIAEGRVQTFDTMEDMLTFLDAQSSRPPNHGVTRRSASREE
jgi:hypothetical protein